MDTTERSRKRRRVKDAAPVGSSVATSSAASTGRKHSDPRHATNTKTAASSSIPANQAREASCSRSRSPPPMRSTESRQAGVSRSSGSRSPLADATETRQSARAAMMAADQRAAQERRRDKASNSTNAQYSDDDADKAHEDVDALRAENNSLVTEIETLRKAKQFQQEVIDSQRSALTFLHGQVTCHICFELVWRPQVLSPCGHTFCARCLFDWFQRPSASEDEGIQDWMVESERRSITIKNNHKRRKLCPHCRTEVKTAPAEVWALKSIVDRLHQCSTLGQITPQDQTDVTFATPKTVEEERKMRGMDLPTGDDLWKDIFDSNGPARAFFNESDRTWHCGECGFEIENGSCINCGMSHPEIGEAGDGGEYLDFEDEDEDYDSSDLAQVWDPHTGELLEEQGEPHEYADEEEGEHEMEGFIVSDEDDIDPTQFAYDEYEEDEDDEDGIDVDMQYAVGPLTSSGRRRGYSDSSDEAEEGDDDDDDVQEVHASRSQPTIRRGRRSQPIVVDSEEEDNDEEEERSGGDEYAEPSHRHRHRSHPFFVNDEDDDEEEDGVEEVLRQPSRSNRQALVINDSDDEESRRAPASYEEPDGYDQGGEYDEEGGEYDEEGGEYDEEGGEYDEEGDDEYE